MPSAGRKKDKIKGEELLKFRCNRCGVCCRLRIPLTDTDVRRLMKASGKPAEKIVQFFKRSDFGKSPGPIAWIKFGPPLRARRAMCMRETRDRCFFLRKDGCIVYEHRPVVCREHPFMLELDENDRKIVSIERNKACECSHTLDGKINKRYLKQIHRESLAQDEKYFAKVRRWNRRKTQGNERDFLEYLGLID